MFVSVLHCFYSFTYIIVNPVLIIFFVQLLYLFFSIVLLFHTFFFILVKKYFSLTFLSGTDIGKEDIGQIFHNFFVGFAIVEAEIDFVSDYAQIG